MKQEMDELFIQVDANDKVVGSVSRKCANSDPTIIHRSIKVFVYNRNGELLVQKRSSVKDTFPDCWDVSVAGHVDWGETYEEAAIRETQEEIGLVLQPENLQLLGKLLIRLPWETEFQQAYKTYVANEFSADFPLEEVSEAKFVDHETLRTMLNDENTKWASPALEHFAAFGLV